MANWGDVIAQGVLQGLGNAGMNYVEDMRRTRMNDRKMNQSMDLFKRQSLFTQKQATLEQMNASAEEWRQAAQMDTGQLAYNVAMKMTEGFSKGDRSKAFRDYIKRLNGKSKAELLAVGGYTQPDYSQFADDPDFKDAIPKSYLGSMNAEQYGMDKLFKYNPREYEELSKQTLDKLTDSQRKVARERQNIKSAVIVGGLGTGVSDALADLIVSNIGNQDVIQNGVDMRTQYLKNLINAGRVTTNDEGELVLVKEMEPMGTDGEPQTTPTVVEAFVADPEAAQRAEDEKEAEKEKAYQTNARDMSKTLQKEEYLPVVRAIEDAKGALEELDDDSKDYIFGALAAGGEFTRKAAAKVLGSESAEKAGQALRKLAQIRNIVLLQRSGAAVTDPEMQRFVEELNQPGALTSENALMAGLDNLVRLNVDGIKSATAGYDEDSIKYFLDTPSGKEYTSYINIGEEDDAQGSPEESPQEPATASEEEAPAEPMQSQREPEGTSQEPAEEPQQTPSLQDAISFVDQQIAMGKLDESQRTAAIQHIANKMGLREGVSK